MEEPQTHNAESEDELDYNYVVIGDTEMQAFDPSQVVALLKLESKEDYIELFHKASAKAKSYGLARALKASVVHEDDNEMMITAGGIYILCMIASDYKKYSFLRHETENFKKIAFDDLLKYFGKQEYKDKKPKRNSESAYSAQTAEDIERFMTYNVDAATRTPDLESIENKQHLLYGKSIVITGNFTAWPNRADLVKLIVSFGGHVKTSISKKTHYVIVGSDAGPAKLKQIEESQIKSITEKELIEILS